MKLKINKKVRKWFRILHRDIGYILVGITLVYSISGIILNHVKGHDDPAFEAVNYEYQFPTMLDSIAFAKTWETIVDDINLLRVLANGDKVKIYVNQGLGHYYTKTGKVEFQTYEKKPFVYFINRLHNNQAKGWLVVADVYAGLMIFLALSGLIMVAGKKGFVWRGAILTIAGILFVAMFYFL